MPHVLLVGVVLMVASTRILQARESLWLDELHTAWVAAGTLASVAARAAAGNQSPLFFWSEWALVHLFGASEWTLRALSLLAGSLLPVALFAVTARWTDSKWLGLVPAWLVAIDPQAIYYGTEARPYAVIQLLAVCHMALFADTVERPTTARRMAVVVGMVLMFYLHYTALLLLAAEVVYFAARRFSSHTDTTYRWSTLGLDVAAVAVLSLGAWTNLQAVYARHTNWESFVAQRSLLEGLLMVPWAWTALIATAVLGLFSRFWRRSMPRAPESEAARRARLLLLCWLLVPVMIAWLATASNVARLLHPRYLAGSTPAALLLLALTIRTIPWRSARLGAAIVLVLLGAVISPVLGELRNSGRLIGYRTDDWRSALAFFNRQPGHNRDPVLVRSLLLEADALGRDSSTSLADYALLPVTALYPIDAIRERLIPLAPSARWMPASRQLQRIRDARGLWMISGVHGSSALEQLLTVARTAADSGSAFAITTQATFGSVRVTRFERVDAK